MNITKNKSSFNIKVMRNIEKARFKNSSSKSITAKTKDNSSKRLTGTSIAKSVESYFAKALDKIVSVVGKHSGGKQ